MQLDALSGIFSRQNGQGFVSKVFTAATGGPSFSIDPQCLHLIAAPMIVSPQKGHGLEEGGAEATTATVGCENVNSATSAAKGVLSNVNPWRHCGQDVLTWPIGTFTFGTDLANSQWGHLISTIKTPFIDLLKLNMFIV